MEWCLPDDSHNDSASSSILTECLCFSTLIPFTCGLLLFMLFIRLLRLKYFTQVEVGLGKPMCAVTFILFIACIQPILFGVQ